MHDTAKAVNKKMQKTFLQSKKKSNLLIGFFFNFLLEKW